MLAEFSLKLLHSTCVGKFLELTFLENALIRGIFNHVAPHSKLALKFLSSRPRQTDALGRRKLPTSFPQAAFF